MVYLQLLFGLWIPIFFSIDAKKSLCWIRTLETPQKKNDFEFVCGFSSEVTANMSFSLLTALLIPLASLYQMAMVVRDCVSGIYTVGCVRLPYSYTIYLCVPAFRF